MSQDWNKVSCQARPGPWEQWLCQTELAEGEGLLFQGLAFPDGSSSLAHSTWLTPDPSKPQLGQGGSWGQRDGSKPILALIFFSLVTGWPHFAFLCLLD